MLSLINNNLSLKNSPRKFFTLKNLDINKMYYFKLNNIQEIYNSYKNNKNLKNNKFILKCNPDYEFMFRREIDPNNLI